MPSQLHLQVLSEPTWVAVLGLVALATDGAIATAFVTQDVELLMRDREAVRSLAKRPQREADPSILCELGPSLALYPETLRMKVAELRRLECR